MLDTLRAPAARLNRQVVRHWPVALGGALAHRALHKFSARPGVRLDGTATWGGRFRCDLHDFIASRIYYFGVWEPNLTSLLMRRLAPGDVFVDVGANMGYFSLLASRLVGDAGGVVAFEASPATYAVLAEDVAMNRATNVRAVNVAVSDRPGTLALYSGPSDNRGATSLHAERGGRFEANVRAAPLLDLLEPEERARVRLMKIDVEGAELPILLDVLEHLGDYSPRMEVVVEVAPDEMRAAGVPVEALLARFAAHGFHWYELENHHDPRAYFDARPQAAVRGTTVPTRRTDVVFSREDAPALA
ncbi:hypothetical protein tb265_42140 [Gemmatimonadetes bacterium T265]|nr:hypothetical protein tb265_42140 [Gemmatimonadetes bacterium T265]